VPPPTKNPPVALDPGDAADGQNVETSRTETFASQIASTVGKCRENTPTVYYQECIKQQTQNKLDSNKYRTVTLE